MSTISERLRNWTTDWDGSKMVPGESPRDGIHCDVIDEAADVIDALVKMAKDVRQLVLDESWTLTGNMDHITAKIDAALSLASKES